MERRITLRMRESRCGSEDGRRILFLKQDIVYFLQPRLAQWLLRNGYADFIHGAFMTDYPPRLITRVAEPDIEPVSLTEAKLYLRIDDSVSDSLIAAQIKAARLIAEEQTGRSLITQSWKIALEALPDHGVALPRGPVQAIIAVTVTDSAGDETILATDSYRLDAAQERLIFSDLPSGERLEITYLAGYGDAADDVPAPITQAILLHVAQLYERRDAITSPQLAQDIYRHYRRINL